MEFIKKRVIEGVHSLEGRLLCVVKLFRKTEFIGTIKCLMFNGNRQVRDIYFYFYGGGVGWQDKE